VDDLLAVAGYQLELIELQESDELLQLLTEKNSLLEFYKTLPDTLQPERLLHTTPACWVAPTAVNGFSRR